MSPETSSFESSSISAGTAETALEESPKEIGPLFTTSHVDRDMEKGVGGRSNRVTYWGFAVSG